MISVIMPVYNCQDYISSAIESILNQTYKDFELIIVNDGSVDNTFRIVCSYKDPRIVVIDRKVNKGLVYSLNEGLKKSKGDFIARMDADDIATNDRFELQVDFLTNHPDIGICGGFCQTFGLSNNIILHGISFDEVKENMRFYCDIAHPTVMMRRSLIDKDDFYNQDFLYAEDYELWCRLLRRNVKIANIPKILLYYRMSNTHISHVHCSRQVFLTSVIVLHNLMDSYKISFDEKIALSNDGVEYCIKSLEKLRGLVNNLSLCEKKYFSQLCYYFSLSRKVFVLDKLQWYIKMFGYSFKSIYYSLKIIYRTYIPSIHN